VIANDPVDGIVPNSTPARYTNTAIALHWLTFALIASGFGLAVYMTGLQLSPRKLEYFSWHKWIGVTVFMLVVARLAWRLVHPAPALPAMMPAWQQRAAVLVHAALYALMLVIPLTGWLYSSASGIPTVYLGLLQLPDLLEKDKALAAQLKLVHVTLNYTMLTLVVVHAAAALKHHFVDRDGVLKRMLPLVRSAGEL
jgi:cytochrome b561